MIVPSGDVLSSRHDGSTTSAMPSVRLPWVARKSSKECSQPSLCSSGLAVIASRSCSAGVESNSSLSPARRAARGQLPQLPVDLHDLGVLALQEPGDLARVEAELLAQPVEPDVRREQRVHHLEVDLPRPLEEGLGVGEVGADLGR